MSEIELTVRAARPGDIEAVWAIERSVFGADAWNLDTMRSEFAGEYRLYVVLVDDSGTVRGYAGLLAVGDDCDIQTIAVAPEARGDGYGRLLMEHLLDEADRRDVQQVFLEVRADNPSARGLYGSLGFEEIDVRPRYYQPEGVDAVVMRLRMEDRR